MPPTLLDAVYGCLIGGAIGDSLGAPVEGLYYTDIRERYAATGGRIVELEPFEKAYCGGPPGSVTDDSTLRHYLCLAIVRKGGRVTPDDFADVWLDTLNPDRLWANEKMIHQRLRIGMNPWDTGKGAPPCGCATMAIAPVGIVNAGNPAQAYQDGFCIAYVNQDDVNRDAAATTAAAVAAAFAPGATVDTVIETMFQHSSFLVKRALERTMDLARDCANMDEFCERFYATMLDWTWPQPRGRYTKERNFSGSSLEFMPVVPAILHLARDDPNWAIVEGASFGRDCDTIASVVGNIVGVLHGASAFRPDWVEACERANVPFFREVEGDPQANFRHMAERLVTVLQREAQAAETRTRTLAAIIGKRRPQNAA